MPKVRIREILDPNFIAPLRICLPVTPPPGKLPWKPWPAGGEDAYRLDLYNVDPDRIVTATVRRNSGNRWEWAFWIGSHLYGEGDHHRRTRAFSEAGAGWLIGGIR